MMVNVQSSKKRRVNNSTRLFIGDEQEIVLKFDADCITQVDEDILIDVMQVDPSLTVLDGEVAERIKKKKEMSLQDVNKLVQRIATLEASVKRLTETNEKLRKDKVELINLVKEEQETIEPKKVEQIQREDEVENLEEIEELDEPSPKFTKTQLLELRVSDLREIAKNAGIKSSDYIQLKKPELVEYLLEEAK